MVRRSPVKRETHGFESHSLSDTSGWSPSLRRRARLGKREVAAFESFHPDFLRRMQMELHRLLNDFPTNLWGDSFIIPRRRSRE